MLRYGMFPAALLGKSAATLLSWHAYLAPNNPELRAFPFRFGFVYVCYSLAQVKLGLWLAVDTVNLD